MVLHFRENKWISAMKKTPTEMVNNIFTSVWKLAVVKHIIGKLRNVGVVVITFLLNRLNVELCKSEFWKSMGTSTRQQGINIPNYIYINPPPSYDLGWGLLEEESLLKIGVG